MCMHSSGYFLFTCCEPHDSDPLSIITPTWQIRKLRLRSKGSHPKLPTRTQSIILKSPRPLHVCVVQSEEFRQRGSQAPGGQAWPTHNHRGLCRCQHLEVTARPAAAQLLAPGRLSSWQSSASSWRSRGRPRTATRRPRRTGHACSTCWWRAAPCTRRRPACSGRARTRDGWPPAGGCPWWRRTRPPAAQRYSWRGCVPGIGGCSPCPPGRTGLAWTSGSGGSETWKRPRHEHCADTHGTWSHSAYRAAWCEAHRGGSHPGWTRTYGTAASEAWGERGQRSATSTFSKRRENSQSPGMV